MAPEVLEPAPGLGQQVPGHVVLGVPDPGIQAGADPAARMQAVQRAPLGHLVQVARHGRGDDVLVGLQLAVKGVQEIVAVAWVKVPGVLAVERDGDEVLIIGLLLPNPAQAGHHVGGRVQRRHPVVVETDHV